MSVDASSEAARSEYRKVFDAPVSRFISAMWGGDWHLGMFEDAGETLVQGQMRVNRMMGEAADLSPGQEVVEVACGIGGTARFLAREYGVRVVATNIAEAQLEEAREITAADGLADAVEFRFADYHELPFADGSFDCWWCQEALLYSSDKRRVLSEAVRVVRSGGSLIVSDLTLSRDLPAAERQEFEAAMKTNCCSREELDGLIRSSTARLVGRRDLSRHAAPTYERLLGNFDRISASHRERVGPEAIENTRFRITRQYELAHAGHLGWIFYALRR